jgi:hypothetical protein
MIKNISKFELTIDGKIFELLCDSDSQIGQVKEFVFQVTKYLGAIEDNIKAQQEKEKEEKKEQVPDGDKQ